MSNIISKTDSMIRQVKKTLRELESFRLKLEHPYSEDRFDHLLQAADAAEVTCLQLRQMLVACLSTSKEKLLDDIADMQGYSVEERNGVICIRTPALPLKKTIPQQLFLHSRTAGTCTETIQQGARNPSASGCHCNYPP